MNNWKVNLTVLWFGQFMVTAGMSMILPFLPLYIKDLGVTEPDKVSMWTSFIFAANFITSFLVQPIWGNLADRYGRKVMLLRSGFGMSIVIVLMGFATNVWHLLFLRMLNGTISGFIPAATALISATTPKKNMGFALGTLQSGAVAGTILGPFIGGLLADAMGFQAVFFVTGGLIFLAAIIALVLVKEKFDKKAAHSQPKISTIAGLQKLRTIESLPSIYAVTFMIQFGMMNSMPFIPLFVEELYSGARLAFFAGLVGSVTGFANMAASPLLGRIGDRYGRKRVLVISLIGAGLSFIPQVFVQNIWQLLAARFILGIFIGGLLPSANALVREKAPDDMVARAFSFNTSSMSLGNMMGPIAGGILYGLIGIRGIFIVTFFLFMLNVIWVRKKLMPRQSEKPQSAG